MIKRLRQRSLDWVVGAVLMVDQTRLPDDYVMLRIEAVPDMLAPIRRLSVRGASAMGIAGALGVALAVIPLGTSGPDLEAAVNTLSEARPRNSPIALTGPSVLSRYFTAVRIDKLWPEGAGSLPRTKFRLL